MKVGARLSTRRFGDDVISIITFHLNLVTVFLGLQLLKTVDLFLLKYGCMCLQRAKIKCKLLIELRMKIHHLKFHLN